MLRSPFLWKLFAGYVLVILIVAAVLGFSVARQIERVTLEETGAELRHGATLLLDIAKPVLEGNADLSLQERVVVLGAGIDTRLTVVRADGTVIADSEEDPSRMRNHADRPEIREARAGGLGSSTRFSATLGVSMMYVALPVHSGGRLRGFVRTSLPLTALEERLGNLRLIIVGGAGIAVVVALALGFFVSRQVTGPLVSITKIAEAIAAGDYDHKLSVHSRDEIGKLSAAFNSMAEQLRERMNTITNDRNKLIAILSSMLEGVVAVDSDERVLHMNDVAARILGTTPLSSVGQRIWEVTRMRQVNEALESALRGNGGTTGDFQLVRLPADRELEICAAPLKDQEGEMVGAVVVLHDVTELHRLSRVRQEFVSNASHELKTPVAAIRGMVETIIDDPGMPSDQQVSYLSKVRSQTERLSRLIDDLLILSQVESIEGVFEREALDLRDIVRESAQPLLAEAKAKGQSVEIQLPPGEVVACCDEAAMRQVLENLVDNAIKYTPRGGTIRIRVQSEGHSAVIEVQDTGVGIEPREQEHIFERFYCVDKARSRELGGTGLGLSIVKHIVQAHGGQVSVESVPGRGSTFRVRIPLSDQGRLRGGAHT